MDLLGKHETKLRKALKYLETLGNCWAVQICLNTYAPQNDTNPIEIQTTFMAILLVVLKQLSVEEQRISMTDIESKVVIAQKAAPASYYVSELYSTSLCGQRISPFSNCYHSKTAKSI